MSLTGYYKADLCLCFKLIAYAKCFYAPPPPPTSMKLRGHIGLGLSIRLSVRASVRVSSAKVTLTLGQELLELGS